MGGREREGHIDSLVSVMYIYGCVVRTIAVVAVVLVAAFASVALLEAATTLQRRTIRLHTYMGNVHHENMHSTSACCGIFG